MHLKPINHRHLTILMLCLFHGLAAYSQAPINSIRIRSPRTKISSSTKLDSLTGNKDSVSVTFQYMDGLGRPVQTVQQQGSPAGNDIVQPMSYDQYGRDTVKYLPYTISADTPGVYQPTAVTEQHQFYNSSNGVVKTLYPFAITHYEPSPLNRTLEQGFAGQDWQPGNHTVKTDYASNDQSAFSPTPVSNNPGSRMVVLYNTTINWDQSQLIVSADTITTYAAGELYLTISKDENWNGDTDGCLGTVEEYKDKEGHVVCKRTYNQKDTVLEMLSTYYVYDDLGHLAFVLPPIASPDSTGTISQATLDNLCYQYRYDERGRMTQKKLPGKGWEYMVYNIRDQVVATRDANQQAHTQWIYTQYDGLQRITATGTTNLNETRAVLQAYFDSQTTNNGRDLVWPLSATQSQVLTTNYYDSYSGIPSLPAIYSAPTGASMSTTGLLTATKTAVLNQPGDFLLKVFYYDELGRSVKTYAQHYYQSTVDTGNYDAISSSYNFTNAVTGTTRQHYNYNGDPLTPKLTINNTYGYDHLGRKTATWETITGDSVAVPRTLISQLDYNELGQVSVKHLGSRDSVNFLQDVGYRYNERGWMLQNYSGLFTEQLQYNQAGGISGMATVPQYNGNIASQSWDTDTLSNSFIYNYDRLNRLTSGVTADSAYAEKNITYDQAGNIQTLSRVYGGNLTDSLVYNYTKNAALTNQVQTIQDLSADPGTIGFAAGTGSYHYDPNGNMNVFSSTNPAAKTYNVVYNLLNLPYVVGSATHPVYEYDANGEKLNRNDDNGETDYISGIQYDNGRISFIQTEEGRVFPYSTDTSNYYQYFLADHLGNTRIAFDTPNDTLKVEQQDDYLPFGMEISQGTAANPKNEYLYNKKELQEDSQLYDYGARFYDPVTARWGSPDLLAEISYNLTPYRYCFNNPVNFIDPYGLWETDANGNQTTNKKEDIERFTSYLDVESALNVTPNISQVSSFVNEEKAGSLGKLTDGSKLLNPIDIQRYHRSDGEHGWKVDQKSFSNFWHQIQGDLTPDALDPRTVGHNLFWLTYTGPWNPKKYNGKDSYDYSPENPEDVPAYVHDKAFDNLHVSGADAVLNDPRTVGANVTLVNSEIGVALSPNASIISRVRAIMIADGIGAATIYNSFSNTVKETYSFHP